MAILSKGIKFSVDASGAGTTFTEVLGLLEVPELGVTPEKVEVTTLADANKRYIKGIGDYGDLAFRFLYDNDSATANYRVLKVLETATVVPAFQIEFPDGTSFEFKGEVSVKTGAASVNNPLDFTLSVALDSEITVTNPSAGV